MGTIVLLDLMGGVALLLWGLHMVQSGVMRALGADLRRLLSRTLRNRFAAFAGGLGLTALLQSSTATGLMTASLAADGRTRISVPGPTRDHTERMLAWLDARANGHGPSAGR